MIEPINTDGINQRLLKFKRMIWDQGREDMPYKRVGKKIYSKKSGRWKLKQTCTSVKNAKKAKRLLHAKTGH